ncbi:YajG family lipoprotein [Halopseudomonas phragmitis]|uniref:Lipoprotein n=2 Tax=Pseudomonadaceae TaxID=135621 RepID=A0A1V0B0T4_9GAMM|nr:MULTISPECIES: YajG family lipoprotein [Pseudomonadaceae]AQZ93515.1 hypothetical protein BVH74_01475 [Halopseudomonas phragmitis]RHW19793.1 hypothetical protein C2846_17035 [Pseudomonas jilinensis]
MFGRLGMLVVAAMALVLVGCAHSPQQLNVQPQVQVPLNPVARQQPVVVVVQDTRPSKVLGTRGGIYPDSSNITINEQSLGQVRHQVEQAVRQLGFNVVPEGTPNANRLTVSLADLRYQSPKSSAYVTQADISATFAAEARSSNQQYQGRYSASAQHRFGYAPNQATNTRLVTEVMSDALTRVFQDPTIVEILQR